MEMKSAVQALNALSHESRLAAFRLLIQAGTAGLSVGELRERVGIPPATLTAHLNVLRGAGMVEDQREGRVIRVRANFGRMTGLLAFLTANCCQGGGACDLVEVSPPTRKKSTASS